MSYKRVFQTRCPENGLWVNLFGAITAWLILCGEENRGNARAAVGNGRDVLLKGWKREQSAGCPES